jgi:hypothetical protein
MTLQEDIRRRAAGAMERIARAAERSRRHPSELRLVAVSKTFPPGAVRAAYEAGLRLFGENRMDEALLKQDALADLPGIEWHMVGQVQTRKAREAVGRFALIHSLDREKLAAELDRRAEMAGVPAVPVLLQVDFGGGEGRAGMAPEALEPFLQKAAAWTRLRMEGLMTLPPLHDAEPRPFFRRLRELRDSLAALGLPHASMRELSMGMTADFECAVEEGATLLRLGTALFGERS